MQDFIDALLFAYKQITRRYIMRYIVAIGVVVTVVWAVIGFVFWDGIIAVSTSLVELVPFSFIRSNGAVFLSTFLYMQVVLLSFAVVHAFLMNLYLDDDQKERSGWITLTLVVGSALFWAVVWFFNAATIHTQLEKILTWLPFETVEVAIAYLLGFYLLYNMVVISMTMAASIYSPKFLARVREHECPYDPIYEERGFFVFRHTVRDAALFFGVSLLAFPLLFVPFVNFVIQIALWVWLAKDTLFFDAATLLFKNPKKSDFAEYKWAIWGIACTGSFFNFVPVINIFGPFFSEIAMFYYLKQKREEKTSV